MEKSKVTRIQKYLILLALMFGIAIGLNNPVTWMLTCIAAVPALGMAFTALMLWLHERQQ